MKEQNKQTKKINNKKKSQKAIIIGLSVATGVLGLGTIGFGVGYGITQSKATAYSIQLENIYQKNYYELVDNVNNIDTKISKLLASDEETYQAKMLSEISQSAKEMQNNIVSLPLSNDTIFQTVRFVNQMSGYTQILEEKISKGENISEKDMETLRELHDVLTEMKQYLNQLSKKVMTGYSILEASSIIDGQFDSFSLDIAHVKSTDTDYPTMIYDGPFSDSVVNKKIVGLSGKLVSKEEAYQKVDSIFKNIANLKYQGKTNGKFETYNYDLLTSDNQTIYVQVTQQGGHILTVSGNVESTAKNISMENAEKIALDFVKQNGIENAKVVWSEELNSQVYFNIAPEQNKVILYPDLVKVKVDLENADVIGYDAMTYWTNHKQRNLSSDIVSANEAKTKVSETFDIKEERLVLAPLDYNREVLCWEFKAERNGAIYYIYINAETNIEENILKVVNTEDGSKLM